jgi:hypothetical protein
MSGIVKTYLYREHYHEDLTVPFLVFDEHDFVVRLFVKLFNLQSDCFAEIVSTRKYKGVNIDLVYECVRHNEINVKGIRLSFSVNQNHFEQMIGAIVDSDNRVSIDAGDCWTALNDLVDARDRE